MIDRTIAAAVIVAERALLDPTVRADPATLDCWLDHDFTEIGQSGRLWTRAEIIADLRTSDQSSFATAQLTDPVVRELAPQCYLLTYVLQIGARRSRRSSIWRNRDGQWRMLFHQGTPLPEIEKA
jgi:hypothetical protein